MIKRIAGGILAAALCCSLWGCKNTAGSASRSDTPTTTTAPQCDHQMGNWLVKRQATCAREGRQERICSVCYHAESKAIPMVAHTFKTDSKVCKMCYYVEIDPDAQVAELGILTERGFGPANLANSCWDVKIWNGQVFRGAGDYDKNTGATPIFAYDIATQKWQNYGTVPDMAVHSFEVIDGKLCAPGIDPSGGWELGNFYSLEDGKWKNNRTLPNGVHNFDMIEFDGKIFAGLGTEDADDTVAVSTDGGKSWSFVPLYQDGEPFDTSDYKWTRTYEFTQYNGQLYALVSFQLGIGSKHMLFRYENGKMVVVNDQVYSLLGGSSYNRKFWPGEFEFDGACYLTLGSLYAIRDFSNLDAKEKIEMPNKETVVDAFLKDGVIYTLGFTQDKKTREYTIVIYKSTTGKTGSFTEVASFPYDVPPMSFDYDGNHFYVGTGYESTKKEKMGMVLRVKPNA